MLEKRQQSLGYYFLSFLQAYYKTNTLNIPLDPEGIHTFAKLCSRSSQAFQDFSQGVFKYLHAPHIPVPLSGQEIWKKGSVKLLSCGTGKQGRPLLILPSWTLNPGFLALTPQHHFLEFLVEKGFTPLFLVREQLLRESERLWSLDEWFEDIVQQAYTQAVKYCGVSPELLGLYSGVWDALYLLASRKSIPRAVLLSAPPVFSAIQNAHTFWFQWCMNSIAAMGILPNVWVRTLFSVDTASYVCEKMNNFGASEVGGSMQALMRIFIAFEDSLNQARDLPQAFLRAFFKPHTVEAFFPKNKITTPLVWIAGNSDRKEKFLEAALFLKDSLMPKTYNSPTFPLSTCGLMASSRAPALVWHEITQSLGDGTKG